MKFGKKAFLFSLIVPVIILLAGIILSVSYKDAVIKILKKYLDKHLTTEIEVSRIDFSVFKKFPNATVEFRNMVAKSGVGFNADDFNINTDTLLTAKSVFFEFSILHLLKGDYKLKNIFFSNGQVNLFIDRHGKNNFSVWESGKTENQEAINFSLQNIIFLNTDITYNDLSNNILLVSEARKLQVKADFTEKNSHFEIKGDVDISRLNMGSSYKLPASQFKVDLDMDITKNDIRFNESSVGAGKMNIVFAGEIKRYKANTVFISFQCNKAGINELIRFYPGQLSRLDKDYQVSGVVDFAGTLKGTLSKGHNPLININFNMVNGSLTNRKNRKKLSGIYLKGDFTNGVKRNSITSLLNVSDFKVIQDKSNFAGSFKIQGFNPSSIELGLKSKIEADGFLKFLNIDTLEQVSGTITSDIFLKGKITSLETLKKEEVVALYKEGSVTFTDVSFLLPGSGMTFTKTNGNVILGDVIKMQEVTFQVLESSFKISSNLSNLPEFLFLKDMLYAEANVESEFLDLKSLVDQSKSDPGGKGLDFPKKITLKSNFSIKTFVYGKFSAGNVTGIVSYKPKEFDFGQFSFTTSEGSVSGSAIINQGSENQISVTCQSVLASVDIQKLFISMNNFSQDVIHDKNLKGKISGSLDFSAIWDEKLQLMNNSVLANSSFEISNGELNDYDPMLGLSKYIDANELKAIKFSTLKNQIYIKDKVITIPEMDINSTAFNIRGMGVHRFDNSYEYRIQVELSEILARKARKKRKEIEEFGRVEDDGLGRLTLPIKITGRGSVYDAALDRRKAMEGFRKNLLKEKVELESIFNAGEPVNKSTDAGNNRDKELFIEWDGGNEKKDFIFEKNEKESTGQPKFIIEWDDGAEPEKRDTSLINQ
ncbi:MAG: AsmA-like C-terminal region-containing protein [Bacteroidales bacterium]